MDEYTRLEYIKMDKFEVDLVRGTDAMLPYGVRVKHEDFNEGDLIHIAWAQKEEIAVKVFHEWVERLRHDKMNMLVDMYTGKVHRKNVG